MWKYFWCILFSLSDCPTAFAQQSDFHSALRLGQLKTAVAVATTELNNQPENSSAAFRLGAAQFLQTIEQLGQSQYRYGLLGDRRRALPFMRLPIPENDTPEKLSYEKARAIFQQALNGFNQAEQTLARIKVPAAELILTPAAVHLDLNANSRPEHSESLLEILNAVVQTPAAESLAPADLTIRFDDADVLWLRGYCHVMAALAEIILAHEWKDQFERTAHLFYPSVETPWTFLQNEGPGPLAGFNGQNVLDLIALIHTTRWDVRDPDGMLRALAHLETLPALSRQSWQLINAEADNDREWIPGPTQQAALNSNLRVTPQMQTQWFTMLDEIELILQGKLLIPFWRGIEGGFSPFTGDWPANPELGINARRIFTQPQTFDLLLWIQGTSLQPWLEKGPQVDPRKWNSIVSAFQGQFLLFAFWFN